MIIYSGKKMKLGAACFGVLKHQRKACSNEPSDSKCEILKGRLKMRPQSSTLQWVTEARDPQDGLSRVSCSW